MRSSEFKEMVLPYSSRLFRLAFSMLGSREEAEDCVQDVFLKLWKMRSQLNRYDSTEALAIRVTRNNCLDILRKRKHVYENENSASTENETSDPGIELEKKERKEIMNKLINELPEPQRTLVYFRHIEQKDYKEISLLVDMNENAIRVSISRARKQLKEMLKNQYASWIN